MNKDFNYLDAIDFEEIISLMPGHIYWKDKNGNFLGCNDEQAKSAGLASKDEIIGKNDYDMPWRRDADEIVANDKLVINSEKPITVEEGNYISRKVPLKNKKGEIIGILGISINIESYREEIELNRKTLDEIIEVMPGHVYWKDRQCVLLGCNEQQAKDCGLKSRHDIVGKAAYDLLWQDQPEEEKQKQVAITDSVDKEIMNLDVPKTIEEHVILPGGEKAIFLSKKVPLHDKDNNVIGLVGISFDISEMKKTQHDLKKAKLEAEALSLQKTEYIAAIDNTFRTPINNIAIALEMLEQCSGITEEHRDYIRLIRESNESFIPILEYTSDYAKLDANLVEIYRTDFIVNGYIDDVIRYRWSYAKDKKLEIFADYTYGQNVSINTDIGKFKNILEILVSNAIKYTSKGCIKIIIDCDSSANEVVFCVEDTGSGIPEPMIDKLFKIETDEKSKTNVAIKLSYCYKLIRKLDGNLWVESKEGYGSKFYFSLPRSKKRALPEFSNFNAFLDIVSLESVLIDNNRERAQAFLSYFGEGSKTCFSQSFNAIEFINNLLKEGNEVDIIFIQADQINDINSFVINLRETLKDEFVLIILIDYEQRKNKLPLQFSNVCFLGKPLLYTNFHAQVNLLWSKFTMGKLNVLIVEDNRTARKILTMLLNKLNCKVTEAISGEEALDKIKSEDMYDLVFLDIGLPGQSGLEVARKIIKKFPEADMKLIALTGLTRTVDLDVLYESNLFDRIIKKPASLEEIESIVKAAFISEND